ncbi:MAG: hypothetical protein II777_06525 [Clostridia bacterium]|nr:hypothetical protein [Clostridia bacterium]
MKRKLIKAAAVTLAALQIFILTSCGQILENLLSELGSMDINGLISEFLTEEQTAEQEQTAAQEQTETEPAVTSDGIPFSHTPDVQRYVMPEETFADELEKEASEIIDEAIAKGIAAVLAMKDERHSHTSYRYDPDANGHLAKLTDAEKEIYYKIVECARNFGELSITSNEYGDILKDAWFNVLTPLEDYEPDIASYLNVWPVSVMKEVNGDFETYFKSFEARYYDPYKDANTYTGNSDIKIEEIKRAMQLMDRIAERIVRHMPENLTAYDKYYYLAATLTVHIKYDDTPKNCFTAFGALVEGRAVCEGYSEAFYLLCKKADLFCAYRVGQSRGQGHQWNMVKLDSGIYNVDVTWCDVLRPFEESFYENFMKTDADFEENGHEAHTGVPSTGTYEPCPYES